MESRVLFLNFIETLVRGQKRMLNWLTNPMAEKWEFVDKHWWKGSQGLTGMCHVTFTVEWGFVVEYNRMTEY